MSQKLKILNTEKVLKREKGKLWTYKTLTTSMRYHEKQIFFLDV